uniref:Uncharacterized protein n=2 Tax=Grammatophora oceanica TaxID=210454 RepID=A0A7S1Y4W5_9STRA|mmetsp:Transcript_21406/g.31869  ORF Transcript_21406/g.31869 Transcript_21406/m.31869 type:complete len:469 (+) Transcript_21406:509-1915(+)
MWADLQRMVYRLFNFSWLCYRLSNFFLLSHTRSPSLSLFVTQPQQIETMNFCTAALTIMMAATATANPFAAKSKNTANSHYVSNLMAGATPTANSQLGRRLGDEEYIPDISGYSVKYEKCQFVKAYDDEMAENEEAGTVLATKRFVVFRLCPTGSCSSCNYNYGEYLIDLETYLESTVEYQQALQEEMCQACEECGNNNNNNNNGDNGDDGGRRFLVDVDCDNCYDECQKIENMEENGYIDATEFLECQMIYDPEDDGGQGLYAGPMCASSGTKIKIGVFLDEECSILDSSKAVDDYLVDGDGYQMKLSHALLKTVYAEDTCYSCLMVDEDENANDDANNNGNDDAEPEVVDMCQALYEAAAKCEKNHGFDEGYSNYYGYENQLAQEEIVCDFIDSLGSGTYDEDGEIIVGGQNKFASGGSKTTGGQKFALTFFILGTVGLAIYAAMLHAKLTKGGKADLSRQGGAMA